MPRELDMSFQELLRRSGGDMDLMRRIEQFGGDILPPQMQAPQMQGYPMMPETLGPQMGVQDPNADLQLPPTVADPQSTPIYDDTNWPYEGGPVASKGAPKAAPQRNARPLPSEAARDGTRPISTVDAEMQALIKGMPPLPSLPNEGMAPAGGGTGGPVAMAGIQQQGTFPQQPQLPELPGKRRAEMKPDADERGGKSDRDADDSFTTFIKNTMSPEAAAAAGATAAAGAVGYGVHRGISGKKGAPKETSKVRDLDLRSNPPPASEYDPLTKDQLAGNRLKNEYGNVDVGKPGKPVPVDPKTVVGEGPSSQGMTIKDEPGTPFQKLVQDSADVPRLPSSQGMPESVKQDEIRPYQSKTMEGIGIEREDVLTRAAQEFGAALDKVPGYENMGSTFANQLSQAIQNKDEKTVVQMLSSLPKEAYDDFWMRAQRLHNMDPGLGLEEMMKHRAWIDNSRFARKSLGAARDALRVFK